MMDIDTIINNSPDTILQRIDEITLRNLVLCAIVLGDADDFAELFAKKAYQSFDELLKTQKEKKRKRGSRNE
jgi:hypothetical protein